MINFGFELISGMRKYFFCGITEVDLPFNLFRYFIVFFVIFFLLEKLKRLLSSNITTPTDHLYFSALNDTFTFRYWFDFCSKLIKFISRQTGHYISNGNSPSVGTEMRKKPIDDCIL